MEFTYNIRKVISIEFKYLSSSDIIKEVKRGYNYTYIFIVQKHSTGPNMYCNSRPEQ